MRLMEVPDKAIVTPTVLTVMADVGMLTLVTCIWVKSYETEPTGVPALP